MRGVHLKLLREVFHRLGAKALKIHMAELTQTLEQTGLKLGVRKQYALVFEESKPHWMHGAGIIGRNSSLAEGTFRQLNAEFGFSISQGRAAPLTTAK